MASKVSRREAVKRVAASGAVLGMAAAVTRWRFDPGHPGWVEPGAERGMRDYRVPRDPRWPLLAIAKTTEDPAELVRRAIDALGGMKRFVSRGDVVALKPNIGWDRLPIHAANTHPQVVAAVVRMALDAGAQRVVVADVSCNEASRSYERSGIWQAAHDAGAAVILPAEHRFRELHLHGDALDLWPIFTPIIDADKVINLPIAKHHGLTKLTAGLKNWYGLLGGRRNQLHQRIDQSIVDLAAFVRPTLTVLDATRVLLRNGPQGGDLDDTKAMHQVVASLDPVAVDAYAATLIGQNPEEIGYLRLGEQRGLGTRRFADVARVEV